MKKIIIIASLFLLSTYYISGKEIATIVVDAGASDRYETPVNISLDAITLEADSSLVLYEMINKEKVPVKYQIEQSQSGRILSWIISSHTKAKSKRRYIIENGKPENFDNVINIKKSEDAILISSSENKVMEYHYGVKLPPKGAKYEYRRSGFIHPLWSPTGEVLTNIQPRDHYHHYGIWNPWTRVTFEGKSVDFWNLADGQGTVRFKAFNSMTGGTVYGGLKGIQEHVVFKPGYEKVAMNETFAIRLWDVKDEQNRKVWLWDFSSTMNCASESPFIINAYRYAGFSIRATPEWNTSTSTILTSEGKTRKDADNTVARWMFCNGKAGGNQSGILFLSYPTNFNFPEPIRVWPERDKDVYMNFNPAKTKDWPLMPGKDYTLQYRVVVYSGEMTAERAEQYWLDYASPPRITVTMTK
ncbi:PmoA family protein [Prevotella sp. 10(H)]|uniref:DUF6807 domain-containing protein n=1 Tax=Prevotella sp. 10(H) TaxID=1158294 RepID=UPI0004A752B7|nr:PmoA family protein [Prevotella sp. 10(H)]